MVNIIETFQKKNSTNVFSMYPALFDDESTDLLRGGKDFVAIKIKNIFLKKFS